MPAEIREKMMNSENELVFVTNKNFTVKRNFGTARYNFWLWNHIVRSNWIDQLENVTCPVTEGGNVPQIIQLLYA